MHGKKAHSYLQRKDTVVLYFTRHCKVSRQDKYKKYYYIFRMLYFTRNNKKYSYLIRSIYDNPESFEKVFGKFVLEDFICLECFVLRSRIHIFM